METKTPETTKPEAPKSAAKLAVKLTGKQYLEVRTLFHACGEGDDVKRAELAQIAYSKRLGHFIATNGYVLRALAITWTLGEPAEDFLLEQSQFGMTARELKLRKGENWETEIVEVEGTLSQGSLHAKVFAVVPKVPTAGESFAAIGQIAIDFYKVNAFLASYSEDPGSFVLGFSGELNMVHVFNPKGIWQGGIMPVRVKDFAPAQPFQGKPEFVPAPEAPSAPETPKAAPAAASTAKAAPTPKAPAKTGKPGRIVVQGKKASKSMAAVAA